MTILKACLVCGELSERARCPAHRRRDERPSAARRGYGPRWRLVSDDFKQAFPICIDCGAPTEVADHDPVTRAALVRRGDPDPDAWHHLKPRCKSCHSRKTVERDGGLGRPRMDP